MEEVNVMIEDKEKVVKEKNSNQERKQILNEYLMKYDIRAGQVIYWYFHSKHPRSKAIEERNFDEVNYIQGLDDKNTIRSVRITPQDIKTSNYAFDTTPRRLITGLITENGVLDPNEQSIKKAFNR